MSKYQIKLLMIFLIGMFFMSFASAISTVQYSLNENGFDIAYPQFSYAKLNTNFLLEIHVVNKSNGINIDDANCFLHLSQSNGTKIFNENLTYYPETFEYKTLINGSYFDQNGEYNFFIECSDDAQTQGGFINGIFYVNPMGEEATTSKAIFYFGILFLLTIFLIVALYGFNEAEQIWSRTSLLAVSYLLFIAISFISWNMAANFMVSSTFVIAFLRIVFLTLVIGFFPFLIGLFVYGFWMMMQIKEIKKLQDQGYSLDEANDKVQNRRKFK